MIDAGLPPSSALLTAAATQREKPGTPAGDSAGAHTGPVPSFHEQLHEGRKTRELHPPKPFGTPAGTQLSLNAKDAGSGAARGLLPSLLLLLLCVPLQASPSAPSASSVRPPPPSGSSVRPPRVLPRLPALLS